MSDDYVRDLGDDLKEWVTHHVGPFAFPPLHAHLAPFLVHSEI
jgi:hypothetical protein